MLKNAQKDFIRRHIGPTEAEQKTMLQELGFNSLDELISKTVPEKILLKESLSIGDSNSEYKALRKLKEIAKKNKVYSSFIGMGYYGTYTPYVILRNILENPGWYTSYTPYQPEVAQGRQAIQAGLGAYQPYLGTGAAQLGAAQTGLAGAAAPLTTAQA